MIFGEPTFLDWFVKNTEPIKNIGIILTGIIALVLGAWRVRCMARTATAQHESTVINNKELITTQISKAVEQLSCDSLPTRIGAIYILGQIAEYSPKDHWAIMKILVSFIRQESPRVLKDGEKISFRSLPGNSVSINLSFKGQQRERIDKDIVDDHNIPPLPREDIRAVLEVLQGRNVSNDQKENRLDLSFTNLSNANLESINLQNAILSGANLRFTNLHKSDLSGADLVGTLLERAVLSKATLNNSKLDFARLHFVNLEEAVIDNSHAFMTSFYGANFQKLKSAKKADFTSCDFGRIMGGLANFEGADFQGSIFDAADLRSSKNLQESQFEQCEFDRNSKLPDYLQNIKHRKTSDMLNTRLMFNAEKDFVPLEE
jgi:uncharacterized protein YjbI with pentapeptide repeats